MSFGGRGVGWILRSFVPAVRAGERIYGGFQRNIIIFSDILCKWLCDVKYKGQLPL